ncbi:putative hydrolase [Alcanivorax xiamenensis]|uniref:Hydrolase n=1 Tax=Alcanivorax xiamenensis TaxID=1177156 RepID=A0ABQ6Y7M1_9GAMM|nr:alpha/beta fold hydrolase [Alcanivorax xiamenensis]KAF0805498.1 putative hydrolase [Alcanivorax xiamenensis]
MPTPQQPKSIPPALISAFAVPERPPLMPQEQERLDGGEKKVHSTAMGTLVSWTFGAGPRIVLVHGWSSRAAHMLGFVDPLLAAGYSVSLFDGPAHGDASGDRASVVHMGEALLALTREWAPVHGVLAHSVGSAAALWAFHRGLNVHASVHLGGPVSLSAMVRRLATGLGLDQASTAAFEKWVEDFIGHPLTALDLEALKDGLRHPGLIVHDPEDDTVPFSAADTLHRNWPQSELIRADRQGHRRLLRDPAMIRLCSDFIATAGFREMARVNTGAEA